MLTALSADNRAGFGGKAAALGVLLRAGLSVPDGFVVPNNAQPADLASERKLRDAVSEELARLGNPVVAVRSSGRSEDGAVASAAGQYESVIGVQHAYDVWEAIRTCWESARAPRVSDYWARSRAIARPVPGMAVLVQRMIDADVSGITFTPQRHGESTRVEASWGLGLPIVGGTITPDSYESFPDGTIRCVLGSKQTRIDLDHEHGGIITNSVSPNEQSTPVLDATMLVALTELGNQIAGILGGPQDIEWCISDGVIWVLQARPVTAPLPPAKRSISSKVIGTLRGTPGSRGIVTATARIVRGPSDFASVRRGDIVICPCTDPAWTPLFAIASGVVTEAGGALSHAAIVAREYRIPAVLGVSNAMSQIDDEARIVLDGAAGTIALLAPTAAREKRKLDVSP